MDSVFGVVAHPFGHRNFWGLFYDTCGAHLLGAQTDRLSVYRFVLVICRIHPLMRDRSLNRGYHLLVSSLSSLRSGKVYYRSSVLGNRCWVAPHFSCGHAISFLSRNQRATSIGGCTAERDRARTPRGKSTL